MGYLIRPSDKIGAISVGLEQGIPPLSREPHGDLYAAQSLIHHTDIIGSGTSNDPFVPGACGKSSQAFGAIVRMWEILEESHPGCYISVGGHVFQIVEDGVRHRPSQVCTALALRVDTSKMLGPG